MVSIFNKISVNNQKKLLKLLEANTIFFKKDNAISSMIKGNIIGVVIEGYAQIIKTDYNGNRTIIEELVEGSVFGSFISSLNNNEYNVLTKEDTKIIFFDYEFIINFENNGYSYYNQFIKNLLEITTELIDEKNKKIEILTQKTIRDKLLTYFEMNFKKTGSKNIYLASSYTDLADYLAIDRSAMSRELKNLKNEGFITTKGRKITLLYK
ncbi:MAG TPA: Crp/Fnr family transcriptional regulator [Candidatus Onthousia faecavium]|nr:Crp/Fnr family transcriptional regulator [Candidatus Onthousia faecavium]